jgi:hypothetical protein
MDITALSVIAGVINTGTVITIINVVSAWD